MTDTGIVDEISTSARTRAEDTKHEESFMASFTRADTRIFVITFAGTLAASVLTVVVVGLGLLVVRVAHQLRPDVPGTGLGCPFLHPLQKSFFTEVRGEETVN
jgi:hypothetical protein